MDRRKAPRVCLAAAAFLTTIGARYQAHAVAQDPPASVRVVVDNAAGFPPVSLDAATSLVASIYQRAGVTLEWDAGVQQMPRQDNPPHKTVTLRIVPPSATFSQAPSADVVGFMPGTSGHHGGIAYVLAGRVEEIARGYQVPRRAVLAAAMAHELGHLLLPDGSHTPKGLMRGWYNQTDFRHLMRGDLLLTAHEGASIRASLTVEEKKVALK
jgi:hypothetical protein